MLYFFQDPVYLNYDGYSTVFRHTNAILMNRDEVDDPEQPNVIEFKAIGNTTGNCLRLELISCGELATITYYSNCSLTLNIYYNTSFLLSDYSLRRVHDDNPKDAN